MADSRAKRKGALIPREKAPTIDARYIVNGVSRHDLSSGSVPTAWSAITGKPTTLAGYGITDAASDAELATEAATRAAADTALAAPVYIVQTATATLANERVLTDTATVTWDFSTPGQAKATSSGSGAPTTVDYLVKTADAGLSAERVVTDTTSITVDWSTAGQAKFQRAALTGDVTASANSNATTIANDAVTYAKMQNVSADTRILGRAVGAGAGDVTELTGAQVAAITAVGDATNAGVLKLGASGGAQEYGKIAGVTVSGTPSPGRLLLASSATAAAWRIPASAQAMYGSGADGALTLDGSASIVVSGATIAPVGGVYTLTRDVEATTITMSSTAQLRTAGFRVRCWKLVGESTNRIHDDGNDASGSTNGATISGGTLQRNGSQGGVGVGTAANGNAGNNVTIGVGGVGGTGGAAGVRTGGSGGTVSSMTATAGRYPGGFASLTGWAGTTGSPSAQAVSGGSGGGSGGNATGAGTSSGGGGGGAGRVYIAALEVDYAGTIAADGGDGGAASGGGNAGGGAGGGGGEVLLVTEQLTRTPTLSAAGGAGGAGVGTGAAGASGSAGITNTISPQV